MLPEYLEASDKNYMIIKLLGHGKGGYSYLAQADDGFVVVKAIHHEPCDYYSFGNKIEAEERDYYRLKELGIRIPEMLRIDREKERIVKQYIEGQTIFELVLNHKSTDPYLEQIRYMADLAYKAGLNIDYFPTNFVINNDLLWYINYECNDYMPGWNFENRGIRYWSYTREFDDHVRSQN